MHWRMIAARAAGKALPPVAAHVVTHRLYPYALGRAERLPFQVRSVTGSVYAGSTAEYHAHHFALHGYFDWKLWVIARAVCRPGDVIVEIGANVGTETVAFADIVGPAGHVYAFEPFPSNLSVATAALAPSGLSNVTMIQAAVADRAGTTTFVCPPDDGNTGIGRIADGTTVRPDERTVPVDLVTLDEYFGDRVGARFVAMDVEGAERSVLKGGRDWFERHRPVLALEANAGHCARSGSSLAELADVLRGMRYEVHAIRRLGLAALETGPNARAGNWLAIPVEEGALARTVHARIRQWGLRPFPSLTN
jgi:FkbM family methyltransferase